MEFEEIIIRKNIWIPIPLWEKVRKPISFMISIEKFTSMVSGEDVEETKKIMKSLRGTFKGTSRAFNVKKDLWDYMELNFKKENIRYAMMAYLNKNIKGDDEE